MSRLTNELLQIIDQLNDDEKRVVATYLRERLPKHPLEIEWGTTADAILTAIARSSDLTLRGVRGVLAEATFEGYIVREMQADGWTAEPIVGDQAYDFLIEKGDSRVKIQVKMQRKEAGAPKEYGRIARGRLCHADGMLYVVEVQKTRSGQKGGKSTRPYRYGDFDILAVNLHSSCGDWTRFMFTVGHWLLPRKLDPTLIEIFQPVPVRADEYWTDDLSRCIGWFSSGTKKRLYS